MNKSSIKTKAPVDVNVERKVAAIAAEVGRVIESYTGKKFSRAELIEASETTPYPEALPYSCDFLFNMAGFRNVIGTYPETFDKLGNYKIPARYEGVLEEHVDLLCNHKWSRVVDRENQVDCSTELKTRSALILGEVLSILRRLTCADKGSELTFSPKPGKALNGVDSCYLTLFEVYFFDAAMSRGKAKFYDFYFNFAKGTASVVDAGEIPVEELVNENRECIDYVDWEPEFER